MAAKPSHGLPSKPNSSGEKGSLEWFARFFPPSDQMRRVADLALAVPYSVEAGVIVSVECLHNMPEGGPGCASEGGQGGLALFNRRSDRQAAYLYKAIVSMHPPGLFYKEPPLFDSVFYTKTNNLDSVHLTYYDFEVTIANPLLCSQRKFQLSLEASLSSTLRT